MSASSLLQPSERWQLVQADCIEHMAEMPPHSVDFAVFSPPFPSLFAYTDKANDIGNAEDFKGDAKLHLRFFANQLVRVIKPGRVVCIHVQNIPGMKRKQETSTIDFRGLVIRIAKWAGFNYETDWPITKNPQAQAIRTRSTKLQFTHLERDRARSAPAFQDHIIKFTAPGDNAVPVNNHKLTRTEWIEWAEGVWDWQSLRETDTLNTLRAKGEDDTKHICPLQLGVIHRLVRLYSNPDEIVFSPFAGIGSEGYESLKLGRRFYGCEIKDEYCREARANLALAASFNQEQLALFPEEVA
jgi:DNA modification methylase